MLLRNNYRLFRVFVLVYILSICTHIHTLKIDLDIYFSLIRFLEQTHQNIFLNVAAHSRRSPWEAMFLFIEFFSKIFANYFILCMNKYSLFNGFYFEQEYYLNNGENECYSLDMVIK